MALYRITGGGHSRVEDGKNTRYPHGSLIEMNELEAKNYARKIALVQPGNVEELVDEGPDYEGTGGLEAQEIIELSWSRAKNLISEVEDLNILAEALVLEQSGKQRKSVLGAIDDRMDALTASTE